MPSPIYAFTRPSRLTALLLRDTWAWGSCAVLNCLKAVLTDPRLSVDPDRQVRLWSGTLLSDADFEASFKGIMPLYVPPGLPPSFEGGTAKKHENFEGHAETQNFAFSINVAKFDVRKRFGEIKVPTLVVVGRYDLIAPVAYSEEIAKGIPNSQLTVFENSRHSLPDDEPEAFRERLLALFSELGL